MYAVIKTGGKQYRVSTGDRVRVESLPGEAGATVTFPQVLMVAGDGGWAVGTPLVAQALVEGRIIRHGRHPKIHIFKMKRRKTFRRHQGHRQDYTEVEVTQIKLEG